MVLAPRTQVGQNHTETPALSFLPSGTLCPPVPPGGVNQVALRQGGTFGAGTPLASRERSGPAVVQALEYLKGLSWDPAMASV